MNSKITFLTKTIIEVPCSVITRSRWMGQLPHLTGRFMGQKLSNMLVERGLYKCLCRVTTVLTPSDYSFIKTLMIIEYRTKPWEIEFNIKIGSTLTGILHHITSRYPFQLMLSCDSTILCSVVMNKTQGKSEIGWIMTPPEPPRNLSNPKQMFNFVRPREATKGVLKVSRNY